MKSFFLKSLFIISYIILGGLYFSQSYSKIIFSTSIIVFVSFLFKFDFKDILNRKITSFISILIYLIFISYSSFIYEVNLLIFAINCLLVGIYEELIFRYILFFKVLSKNKIIKSTIIVAILFSIVHFPNIRRYDLISVLIQMYFAFMLSIILTGILIKFRSLILISCIHGFINFYGTLDRKLIEYNKSPTLENSNIQNNGLDRLFDSIIGISIILMPFVLLSLFYLYNSSFKKVIPSGKKWLDH